MSINNTAAIAIMEAGVASPSRTATSAGIWRRPALASERFWITVTTAPHSASGYPPPWRSRRNWKDKPLKPLRGGFLSANRRCLGSVPRRSYRESARPSSLFDFEASSSFCRRSGSPDRIGTPTPDLGAYARVRREPKRRRTPPESGLHRGSKTREQDTGDSTVLELAVGEVPEN